LGHGFRRITNGAVIFEKFAEIVSQTENFGIFVFINISCNEKYY